MLLFYFSSISIFIHQNKLNFKFYLILYWFNIKKVYCVYFMQSQKQFILNQSIILLLGFLLLQFFFPIAGTIDMILISPWITSSGIFYLKDNWYLAELSHHYLKNIIILFYAIIFFLWIASFRFSLLKKQCVNFGYFFFVSMICTITIGIFKAHSAHACPWNMTLPSSQGFIWNFSLINGHCFPGGHASSGFALITGYFVYHKKFPKYAYFSLIIGLILGFIMGWTQMMRGAHFLSHNLWTLWIILFINYIVILIIPKFNVLIKYYSSRSNKTSNINFR